MCTLFERLVAFRYLRARRSEGMISVIALFSLIGIALGVATLIVVLSVMRGVRGEMIDSIIGLEGHVTVISMSRGIDGYDEITNVIRKREGIKSAIPVVQGQVMMSFDGQAVGALVSGIRGDDLRFKPLVTEKLVEGDLSLFQYGDGVILGQRMAERMGIKVGDKITLISPEGRATAVGTVPRVKAYPVAGIFHIGMFAYDNGLILMPFEEAQIYFRFKKGDDYSAATAIEISVDDPDQAGAIAADLSRTFGPGFRVYDWKQSNNHLFRAVMVQRNVFFMILTLIIIVASFNIISSLIMLVREKRRDIAILRTMGATRGMIMRIFILCGTTVGVVGTFIGVLLGLLISFNTEAIQKWMESLTGQKLLADELYFLSSLPAKVDTMEVIAVVAMSLGLSFLATIYPARKAAAMDPAEALRYE